MHEHAAHTHTPARPLIHSLPRIDPLQVVVWTPEVITVTEGVLTIVFLVLLIIQVQCARCVRLASHRRYFAALLFCHIPLLPPPSFPHPSLATSMFCRVAIL